MPDDILSFILSFLSIRDSVKARIVSGRWRHICPFMLNRDFDLHTVLGINHKARSSQYLQGLLDSTLSNNWSCLLCYTLGDPEVEE
ncbi:F-box/LRR-repeat protein At4g14103-like [Camellia sinensis]|uniref:F-box/LRR-repeat protein At4g14103-like n=1 Tax=Camellia sinensis TaxID=4442 RepID=UPI0010357651|nr:F-box/LRR-repeat protein At4g14103-like [Camellia sinensis]